MGLKLRNGLAAFLVILVCCFLAWLSGWNFDSRGYEEAYYAFCVLVFATYIFLCPFI